MEKYYTFVIRNNHKFVNYVKYAWRSFLLNNIDGVKITIRKDNVFIHINKYYCVILNDLRFMKQQHKTYNIQANKKALEWLNKY